MSHSPREVLLMIAQDMKDDAARFDGLPFTGATVAEYLGNHGAAIAALGEIVAALLPADPEPERDPVPGKDYLPVVTGPARPPRRGMDVCGAPQSPDCMRLPTHYVGYQSGDAGVRWGAGPLQPATVYTRVCGWCVDGVPSRTSVQWLSDLPLRLAFAESAAEDAAHEARGAEGGAR